MSNYSIRYFLFFRCIDLEGFAYLVHLHFTAVLWISVDIQNWCYVNFLATAWVRIVWSNWSMKRHFYFWWNFVDVAVAHLCNVIMNVASLALEDVQIWPNFPIYFSPWYSISFSNKSYEFLEIPSSINNMGGLALTIAIDVWLCFSAMKNSPLLHCKQLVTKCTFI